MSSSLFCSCGWSGTSTGLVSRVTGKGTPQVSVEPNRCPTCFEFVQQNITEDEAVFVTDDGPIEIRLPQLGPGWV